MSTWRTLGNKISPTTKSPVFLAETEFCRVGNSEQRRYRLFGISKWLWKLSRNLSLQQFKLWLLLSVPPSPHLALGVLSLWVRMKETSPGKWPHSWAFPLLLPTNTISLFKTPQIPLLPGTLLDSCSTGAQLGPKHRPSSRGTYLPVSATRRGHNDALSFLYPSDYCPRGSYAVS